MGDSPDREPKAGATATTTPTPGTVTHTTSRSSLTPTATRRRVRPQEFLLPDGRRILVALPEEAATLRDKYASANAENAEGQVEVVIHGSVEHEDFLRQSAAHHAARRDAMRARHGADFDEWERTAAELEAVEAQLHRIADHSASLGHNFSKFGFAAHLRTYGDDGETPAGSALHSTASSRAGSISGDGGDGGFGLGEDKPSWEDRGGAATIKLFRRPIVKQYFHRGLLWRRSEETHVMSFELFFDLLYVGIIAINGDHVAEGADAHELLRFIVTFGMSWKMWTDLTQVIAWFETDDVMQRVEFLFFIACLLGLTTNMLQTFDEKHDTYVYLTAFYLAARLFTALYCTVTAVLLPLVKGMMISMVAVTLVSAALWIGSTQVESFGERLPLAFVALAIDLFGGMFIVMLFRYSKAHPANALGSRLGRFFEFYPATNIEHKVERTNAFVCLVLGYSVVGIMYQNQGYPLNAFLGKAVLGLCQAFIFNWIYFDCDGNNIHVHAIRRHVISATVWQYAHLLFVMSYILAAAALTRLVLAHDCADTPVESLTHLWEERSEAELGLGMRLFYCVGLGLAMFSTFLISLSHTHKLPASCRFPKWARLANRLAVAVTLCCLPAADAHKLSSLSLVGVTVSLVLWVLIVEIVGKSCPDESFFGQGECKYTARCSRRRLDEALGGGGEVDVNVLSRGEKRGADVLE